MFGPRVDYQFPEHESCGVFLLSWHGDYLRSISGILARTNLFMSDASKDIKFAERTKRSAGDIEAEKPKATEQPDKPERFQITRFQDGKPLAFSPNPRKAGTWVIHDATGTPL